MSIFAIRKELKLYIKNNKIKGEIKLVYFLSNSKHIKIGYSREKVENRIKQLKTGSSEPIILLATIEGTMNDEKEFHNKTFKKEHYNLEWFNPSEELLKYINSISKTKYVELENGEIKVYNKMSKA